MEQATSGKSPDAFRTISEAAAELELQQHVLRFWESKFPQIKPMKRAGGRRYYRRTDIELLQTIKNLLHNEGYTIKGVQKMLRENNGRFHTEGTAASAPPANNPVQESLIASNAINDDVIAAISELETIRETLRTAQKRS